MGVRQQPGAEITKWGSDYVPPDEGNRWHYDKEKEEKEKKTKKEMNFWCFLFYSYVDIKLHNSHLTYVKVRYVLLVSAYIYIIDVQQNRIVIRHVEAFMQYPAL